ncbi:hypothetical protein C8Q79DRAFT_459088 [Trametes meyenii]|nr:hypothetical protein C8Q79DRAFT_459088 [Trametes meyenii]
MSISTASAYSDRSCSTPSSSDSLRDNQLPGWFGEIYDKVHTYGKDVEEFLAVFTPSRTPCTLPDVDKAISDSWTPVKGKEVASYDPLVKILTELVSGFPDDKRPSFYNAHNKSFKFPFQEFAHKHHSAKPDLAVSFPGDELPAKGAPPSWSRCAMVIEAKDVHSKDPFHERESGARSETLTQLAVNARNLMFAHGFLASFALGIYGDIARIVRFDHACAVASPPFSLKSASGLKLIREFLWRFVHPWEGGPGSVLGCDPTFRKLTTADEEWLIGRLGDRAAELMSGVDLNEGRCVKVWDEGDDGNYRTFVLFKLLNVNARLFSRATMVWMGIEDTRKDGVDSCAGEPVVLRALKEAWRQVVRIPEQKFYERLEETIPEEKWVGLPHLLHGGDLGARDVRRWKAACTGEAWAGDDALVGTNTGSPSDTDDASSSEVPADDPRPPYPMHQTYSCRLSLGEKFEYRERSHMRFVVDVVGRPLSRFKSTKELVLAMYDAIRGHRLAMSFGGVMHKDVSEGNILIVDGRPSSGGRISRGILHDFDYSAMTLEPPVDGDVSKPPDSLVFHPLEKVGGAEGQLAMKERTGTYYFMALQLLGVDDSRHDVNHDLESFYWVLIWNVLRHTAHTHHHGLLACNTVFKFGSDTDSRAYKRDFVQEITPVRVSDNAPFTTLLYKFTKLVLRSHIGLILGEPAPLTYDTVLPLFEEAIDSDGWPTDDAAIPFVPPVIVTDGRRDVAKGKNKRIFSDDAVETASTLNSEGTGLDSGATGGSSTRPRKARRKKQPPRVDSLKSWKPVLRGADVVSSGEVAVDQASD